MQSEGITLAGSMMSSDNKKNDLVNSYVQQALSGITEEQKTRIRYEVMQRKRENKMREKKKGKKTLTVFTPFELRTAKRNRIENELE